MYLEFVNKRRVAFALVGLGVGVVIGACLLEQKSDHDSLSTIEQNLWTAGWVPVSGNPVNLVSRPAFSANDTGGVDAWVWGANGSLNKAVYDGAGWSPVGWQGWDTPENGILTLTPSVVVLNSGVSVSQRYGTSYWDMVALGNDGSIYHRYRYLVNGTWSAWNVDGSNGLGGSFKKEPSVAGVNGHLLVIGINNSTNQLSWKWWNGGSWSAWQTWGNLPGSVTVNAPPAVATRPGSQYIDVAVSGSDRNIYTSYLDDSNPSATKSWTNLGNLVGGTNPVDSVAVSSRGGSDVSVWAIFHSGSGTSYLASKRTWTPSTSWQSWDTDGYIALSVSSGLGVLYVGDSPSSGTHVGVVGDSKLYSKKWYDTYPSPQVVLAQDRTIENVPSSSSATCTTALHFENTAVVTDNDGGCGRNVIMSLGTSENFPDESVTDIFDSLKIDGNCLWGDAGWPACDAGAGSMITRCGATKTTYMPVPDGGTSLPAGLVLTNGDGQDNQIIRTNNGLLLVKQRGATNTPTGGAGYVRGTELFFRSTDCGNSWNYQGFIDVCPTSDCNGGADHPSIVRDPNNLNRLYMETRWSKNTEDNRALYVSNNNGSSWNLVNNVLSGSARMPTIMVDNMLFLFPVFPTAATVNKYTNGIYWYDGSNIYTAAADGSGVIVGTGTNPYAYFPTYDAPFIGTNLGAPWWLSRIGKYGNTYYFRMIYAKRKTDSASTKAYQSYVVQNMSLTNNVLKYEESFEITPPASTNTDGNPGSIVDLSVVDNDPTMMPSVIKSTTTLLYWMQTEGTGQPPSLPTANFQNTRTVGCILRDRNNTCKESDRFVLSSDSVSGVPTPRQWNGWWSSGDYVGGAFFYNPSDVLGNSMNFVAHWVEMPNCTSASPPPGSQFLRMNVVKVRP